MKDFADSDDIASEVEGMLAVENTPLPLIVMLPNRRVAMANRAWRDLMGYRSEDVCGRDVLDFVIERDIADQRQAELLATGRTSESTVALRRRDGKPIDVRSSSILVYGDSGEPRLVICRLAAA
ncbi:MAG: fold [Acidimicrobiales bacterium]|jgi:PAS domain S-box-containing protein|nr:fold [Acidimicrobiales bacterium]